MMCDTCLLHSASSLPWGSGLYDFRCAKCVARYLMTLPSKEYRKQHLAVVCKLPFAPKRADVLAEMERMKGE